MAVEPTPRAYTVKLSGNGDWRKRLWDTHVLVNRGSQVWGDWLLTLRGGLPASLADGHPERRVLLALSWLSVESPVAMVPSEHCAATGEENRDERNTKVLEALRAILKRLAVPNPEEWVEVCEPALTARIRDDACWVNRSACFAELQKTYRGLTAEWATKTLFEFVGGGEEFFKPSGGEAGESKESKDFVQKAGGWLSRNWGSGEKSDGHAIVARLTLLADLEPKTVLGLPGIEALVVLENAINPAATAAAKLEKQLKQVKASIGWKGRPSKGAMALDKLSAIDKVKSADWEVVVRKFREETQQRAATQESREPTPDWMPNWQAALEQKIGMSYRIDRDLIWQYGVMLDHALRKVSSAHTWIKRAEESRNAFKENSLKMANVPAPARKWLEDFCERRTEATNAGEDYVIRKRALDAWNKIVDVWSGLGAAATGEDRVLAARRVESDLDDNEKFGDIQLFEAIAADDALCVWHDAEGKPDPSILKNFSDAQVAERDQRRFKVPAMRHPDPLRHPIYVDFGNSRWSIAFSALAAAKERVKLREKLATANTEAKRQKAAAEFAKQPNLSTVSLDTWTGEAIETLDLRWQGKRFENDLDLKHFGEPSLSNATRGDRLGRAVAQTPDGAVGIASIFDQEDWNGRLQVSRRELDRLADLVYGKKKDPSFAQIDSLFANEPDSPAVKCWNHLKWFLTTSAKLQPAGPWLDYVANKRLPTGVEWKTGKTGNYLNYEANKGRKGRARLQLARLPGLRVLSLDLGHRYAAACAVWETLSTDDLAAECKQHNQEPPSPDALYVHLHRNVNKPDRKRVGSNKTVQQTTIYRRVGPDELPDGTAHPATWARLDRQFLIELPGDSSVRFALPDEIAVFESVKMLVNPQALAATSGAANPPRLRIDELQAEIVRLAKRGIGALGNMARIAYIMTAVGKPTTGRGIVKFSTREERVEYVLNGLDLWQRLAKSDADQGWALTQWNEWVVGRLGGPAIVREAEGARRSRSRPRGKDVDEQLTQVAEKLADASSTVNHQLHEQWNAEWEKRNDQWKSQLRAIRKLILPRPGKRPDGSDPTALAAYKQRVAALRQVGGLSLRRLKTIRELYQVLKAYSMRPEPQNLQENVPKDGDRSPGKFGQRILNQLEQLRTQRIKQLASRIIEGALGLGAETPATRAGRRDRSKHAPAGARFAPCHAVVIENLENYRPEETRLRKENRQLMTWSARNVRKLIVDGCQLYGLHFVEVSPSYTSRQDSRTGAPGIRCEDIPFSVFKQAVTGEGNPVGGAGGSSFKAGRVRREIEEALKGGHTKAATLNERQRVLASAAEPLRMNGMNAGVDEKQQVPIRLPKKGGELFVSANPASPTAKGLQADLNAAANIGLKALNDTDWWGAWWFVLVEVASGQPVSEKVEGSLFWKDKLEQSLLPVKPAETAGASGRGKKPKGAKKERTSVYAWSLQFCPDLCHEDVARGWTASGAYWNAVEAAVARQLIDLRQLRDAPW